MYRILKKIKEAGKMISIFNDIERDDRFGVGFIVSLNQEEMLIKSISPGGEYDGYMWLRIEDVFQCGFDGEYEEKIMNLYDACDRQELDIPDQDIRENFLNYSISKKRMLEIVYLSTIISGYVVEYADEIIAIREVDQYGKELGMVYIKMEVVDEIHMDTITCRKMEKLHASCR